jgi:predicted KAP-like P-loop ATPase
VKLALWITYKKVREYMWFDTETDRDFVNFGVVADLAAEMIIESKDHPLSIGISGSWGIGKSSMLKLIQAKLKESSTEKPWIFITFNAWLYQGYDDARAALLEVIFKELTHKAGSDNALVAKAKELGMRVNYLRLLGIGMDVVGTLTTGVPLGTLGKAGKAIFDSYADGDISDEDIAATVEGVKENTDVVKDILKPQERKTPSETIHEIRNEFKKLLKDLNAHLVVFVDDLDRCLPPTVIGTLEAMRLFLFMERTAFVIAADDRMIKEAVRIHFKEARFEDQIVTNYFDKLVNVPLRVPPLGVNEVRAYIMLLFIEKANLDQDAQDGVRSEVLKRLANSWKGEAVTADFVINLVPECQDALKEDLRIADRLARIMTTAIRIQGNPRLVKRFLNTLVIRKRLAKAQGITVPDEILAKILLFERCASEAAFKDLMEIVHQSEEGKSVRLAGIETAARKRNKDDNKIIDLPASWESEGSFILDWLDLDPMLGDIDLRGAFHVGRESLPIVSSKDRLSQDAKAVIETLVALKAADASPKLLAQIRALRPEDRAVVTEKLIDIAARENSWGTPSILRALIAMGDTDTQQATRIAAFLGDRPSEELGPDLLLRLKSHSWAETAFATWRKKTGLSPQMRKALELGDGKR